MRSAIVVCLGSCLGCQFISPSNTQLERASAAVREEVTDPGPFVWPLNGEYDPAFYDSLHRWFVAKLRWEEHQRQKLAQAAQGQPTP